MPRDLDLWSFDPKMNGFPEPIVKQFCVKLGDPSCGGFWDIVRKTDRQTNAAANPTPAITVGAGNYVRLRVANERRIVIARLTEYCQDVVVFEYFDGSARHEVESVENVASVYESVARRNVCRLELYRQRAEAARTRTCSPPTDRSVWTVPIDQCSHCSAVRAPQT